MSFSCPISFNTQNVFKIDHRRPPQFDWKILLTNDYDLDVQSSISMFVLHDARILSWVRTDDFAHPHCGHAVDWLCLKPKNISENDFINPYTFLCFQAKCALSALLNVIGSISTVATHIHVFGALFFTRI